MTYYAIEYSVSTSAHLRNLEAAREGRAGYTIKKFDYKSDRDESLDERTYKISRSSLKKSCWYELTCS